MNTSYNLRIQVILLVYTVIPLPFYLCIIIGISYSIVFEILVSSRINDDVFIGAGIALHICIHLLGIHLFILTQVRQRKTFLKVGQSLLARRDLEIETQFKDHMVGPSFFRGRLLSLDSICYAKKGLFIRNFIWLTH